MTGGCYTVEPDFAAPSCHELHLPRTRADPKKSLALGERRAELLTLFPQKQNLTMEN